MLFPKVRSHITAVGDGVAVLDVDDRLRSSFLISVDAAQRDQAEPDKTRMPADVHRNP
jgi:hypothetical protein